MIKILNVFTSRPVFLYSKLLKEKTERLTQARENMKRKHIAIENLTVDIANNKLVNEDALPNAVNARWEARHLLYEETTWEPTNNYYSLNNVQRDALKQDRDTLKEKMGDSFVIVLQPPPFWHDAQLRNGLRLAESIKKDEKFLYESKLIDLCLYAQLWLKELSNSKADPLPSGFDELNDKQKEEIRIIRGSQKAKQAINGLKLLIVAKDIYQSNLATTNGVLKVYQEKLNTAIGCYDHPDKASCIEPSQTAKDST